MSAANWGSGLNILFRGRNVHQVTHMRGNRVTPSYVAFTEDEPLIGEAAKNQAMLHPSQTLFGVKRLIGRCFNDSTVQEDMKLLPFKVIAKRGKPMIAVKVKGEEKVMAPVEVSSMVPRERSLSRKKKKNFPVIIGCLEERQNRRTPHFMSRFNVKMLLFPRFYSKKRPTFTATQRWL